MNHVSCKYADTKILWTNWFMFVFMSAGSSWLRIWRGWEELRKESPAAATLLKPESTKTSIFFFLSNCRQKLHWYNSRTCATCRQTLGGHEMFFLWFRGIQNWTKYFREILAKSFSKILRKLDFILSNFVFPEITKNISWPPKVWRHVAQVRELYQCNFCLRFEKKKVEP